MNKITDYIAAGATTLVLFGSVIEASEPAPNNVIVYGNSITKTYYGEPTRSNKLKIMYDNSVMSSEKNNIEQSTVKMTLSDAKRMGYEIDEASRDDGDFVGETHCLLYVALQKIGILPRQPRWNPNGTWNW